MQKKEPKDTQTTLSCKRVAADFHAGIADMGAMATEFNTESQNRLSRLHTAPNTIHPDLLHTSGPMAPVVPMLHLAARETVPGTLRHLAEWPPSR